MNVSARVRIHGKVQGVWFRGWATAQAAELGINGWVRNRFDGTVEAVFGGPAAAVRERVERCRRGGPPAARVDRVEEAAEADPVPAGFAQLPTA